MKKLSTYGGRPSNTASDLLFFYTKRSDTKTFKLMLRHSISALPNRFSQNRSRVALLSSAVTRTPFVPLGTVRPPQAVVATVSKPTSFWPRLPLCPVSAALAAACAAALVSLAIASECDSDDSHEMVNWSGTHTVIFLTLYPLDSIIESIFCGVACIL